MIWLLNRCQALDLDKLRCSVMGRDFNLSWDYFIVENESDVKLDIAMCGLNRIKL